MAVSQNIRAGRAYVEVVADSSKLQRGLTEAQAKLRAFGKAATEVGRDMLALSTVMGLPFAYATKSFASFDDSMRMVQAVTQATGDEFDMLTKKAQKLGRETSFTAQQTADAMIAMGRMGFSPQEIDSAIASVLNLSRATGTELAEAADFAANSMRIFGLESEEMTRVADVLTATANGSAQTLTDLFEALKIAGPQAKAANETIEDTNAALGVLANMGIKGSLAGTALRKSFSQFAKADVQETLAEWGIATTDAEGNLRKLAHVMVDIARVMKQMPTAERITFAEEIFDLRGSLAGLSLTANTDDLDAFIAKLQDVEGVADKTARQMDAGLGGSFRLLLSAAEGALNAIGDAMSTTLRPMVDRITAVGNAFTGWIERNGKLVTTIALTIASAAALGATLLVLGTASKIVAAGIGVLKAVTLGMSTSFAWISSTASSVVASFRLMGDAFRNYHNMAQPAIVSTSRLLAALRLPIDSRANQVAASLILMNRAETAAAARGMLVAKWQATAAVLSKANMATIAATVANKAHAVAASASALASKAVAGARALAATATGTLTISTIGATMAATANSAANLALAVTTKVAAAGYLALSMAMKAVCAIPIGVVVVGLVASIALLYKNLSKAGRYTAKLKEEMKTAREEGDKMRKTDKLRMERLQQLAQKQKLSNEELSEAERLASILQGRYGDLGITIDKMTGSLTMAADAQSRFNDSLRAAQIHQYRAELTELQANKAELQKEYDALFHWSNHNLWSALTGRHDEVQEQIPILLDKIHAEHQKQIALELKIAALEQGEDIEEEDELTAGSNLEAAIAEEEMKRVQAQEDILEAEKRVAEIQKQLRRERQSDLENEIEDIENLTDEYVKLQKILKEHYKQKGYMEVVRIIDEQIEDAYAIENERIQRAKDEDAAEKAEGIKTVRDEYDRTTLDVDRDRETSEFDSKLEELQKTDSTSAIRLLEGLIVKLNASVEASRKEYKRAIDEASSDGEITSDEEDSITNAQEQFARLNNMREKYESQLESARESTKKEQDRNAAPTIGSFYAKAMRGLGASSINDKNLKAAEATAKNTKKTVKLLEDMADNSLVFT